MLQLGFGHGVKAAACVWKALRAIETQHAAWGPTPDYTRLAQGQVVERMAARLSAEESLPDSVKMQMDQLVARRDAKRAAEESAAARGTGSRCPRKT